MLRKMLDPDGMCGENASETARLREAAIHCSSIFSNVAGELLCQWVEADDDEGMYHLSEELEHRDAEENAGEPPIRTALGTQAFHSLPPHSAAAISKLKTDDERIVLCPAHKPTDNRAECVNCHARRRQLIEKATPEKQRAPSIKERGVQKVYTPLTSAKLVPMTTWTSSTGNEYPVPKMVDVEGLRMEIPSPGSPLARWRINLRECLSYTTLVTRPDMVSFDMNKDRTDMQCIERLASLQETHKLREGTIPASVFAVAITHFTGLALDESQKASESIEDDSHCPPSDTKTWMSGD